MWSPLYPAPVEPVPPAPAPYVDVVLEGHAGTAISAWFARATPDSVHSQARAAVLYLHGNGENLGTLVGSPLLEALLRLPTDLLVIDYPGYGKSTGVPGEQSLVAAARAALRYLREKTPGCPIIVIGWSLGAAVAAQAVAQECAARALHDRLAGLVLVSPWSSVLDVAAVHAPRFLARLFLRDRYQTERDVATIALPTLVIHGRYDTLIPVEQGRRVAARAGNLSALVVARNAQHNDVFDQPETESALMAFIRQHTGT